MPEITAQSQGATSSIRAGDASFSKYLCETNRRKISDVYEVNFGTHLSIAQNTFLHKLEDGHVIYSPDHPGYPALISTHAAECIQLFEKSNSAGHVYSQIGQKIGSLETFTSLIGVLEERGYLVDPSKRRRHDALEIFTTPQELSVWVHINNHCNLDCAYCFVNKFTSEMSESVIQSSVEKLFKTCVSRSLRSIVLKFAGGEPALSIDKMNRFCELFSGRMKDQKTLIRFAIITNGTIASRKLLEFVKKWDVSVNISMDGYGEEGHDIYRVYAGSGKGSWDKIKNNIDVFLHNDIRPNINATISEESSKTLPQLVSWISKLGLSMRLSVVREIDFAGRDVADVTSAYARMCATFNSSFDAAFAILEDPEIDIDVRNGFAICELSFERPSKTSCCGIGSSHIVIQDDGKIASCPMTIRENSSVSPRDDLVRSARQTVETWSSISRNHVRESNCLDCEWFGVCTSGCPVTNERVFGIPFTISPLHEFYKFVIPRYVIFYGRKLSQAARSMGHTEFHVYTASGHIV